MVGSKMAKIASVESKMATRLPSTGLKIAKIAKTANAMVTSLTV